MARDVGSLLRELCRPDPIDAFDLAARMVPACLRRACAGGGGRGGAGAAESLFPGHEPEAATRTRTGDPIFTRDVLYQLSYGGGADPR